MSACKECGAPSSRGRERPSGLCRKCHTTIRNRDPQFRATISATHKKALAVDPERLEQKRQAMRKAHAAPGSAEKRKAALDAYRSQAIAASIMAQPAGSPSRMKAGARRSATVLAWCPTHLRDDYRALAKAHGGRTAEARRMIEDQHELEMARWRRSVGIEVEPAKIEFVEPDYTPVEKAIELVAKRFGITVGKLFAENRRSGLVEARAALALAMKRQGHAYPNIAETLHKKDHTSAMYWVQKGEAKCASDLKFRSIVDELVACWHQAELAA